MKTPRHSKLHEWQIAGIKEALAALDRGEYVAHEDVKAWAASLGTKDERPIPQSK
jgi:predicted transcriptional regulator